MLQASELRIGNYVNVPYGDAQIEYFVRDAAYFTDGCGSTFRALEPIPLTEEWLERFGFGRIKDKYYDNYRISLGDSYYHSVQIRDGTFWYSNNESDAGCYVLTDIKYVHQLQNLHFALTGQELTIVSTVS